MALNASNVSRLLSEANYLAVLGVYADMSGTERKVERQRRGKGADRVSPEAQWSGVEINLPSLRHRESASLGCLRGETRKADKSCATGGFSGVESCRPFAHFLQPICRCKISHAQN